MIAAIIRAIVALFARPQPSAPAAPTISAPATPREMIRATIDQMWTDYRVPNGDAAFAMLYAIGMQESRFVHRDQVVAGKAPGQVGPATGFWQFERGGGVAGVMQHQTSAETARKAAAAAGVPFDRDAIWRHLATPAGDRLAATFARLLLFTDPHALPPATADAEEEAWQYYLRCWRPGKPHRETWAAYWRQGIEP